MYCVYFYISSYLNNKWHSGKLFSSTITFSSQSCLSRKKMVHSVDTYTFQSSALQDQQSKQDTGTGMLHTLVTQVTLIWACSKIRLGTHINECKQWYKNTIKVHIWTLWEVMQSCSKASSFVHLWSWKVRGEKKNQL